MDWKTMFAYVTGEVDENLLLHIEYLVAENRILRGQIKDRLQLSDAERQTLAEMADVTQRAELLGQADDRRRGGGITG